MRGSRRAQRGVALLGLLAVAVMVFAYVLTSRLNAASRFVGIDREHNAKVMVQAKRALIGWMAMNAAGTDVNPGRLPCPEAPGYFGDPAQEGIAAGSCTLPAVGRLPWRTLGLEKLVDSEGEPLWYAVSTGWALPCTSPPTSLTCKTNINSDFQGQLSFEGTTPVALIIAPGPVLVVQGGTGCTAWPQSRPISGSPDLRNYLECENATSSPADATFVASRAGQTFNDQVLPVMATDVIPALEAAIADRMRREIAPALKTVYVPSDWGFAGSNPIYPYAATFNSPGPGVGTSNYWGTAGTRRGLLAFNQTQGCTESISDPRCVTTAGAFLVFSKSSFDVKTGGSGSIKTQSSCSWQSEVFVCTGEYFEPSISVTVSVSVSNVAMGLRKFDPTKVSVTAMNNFACSLPCWPPQTVSHTSNVVLNADGSATITVATGLLPDIDAFGWDSWANYRISIDRAAIGDHALLSSTDATTGWFVRNEWYRLTYYSVARGFSAEVIAAAPAVPACPTSAAGSPPYAFNSSCLTIANTVPANNKRALLILAGRSLNGMGRPSSTLSDYLEFGNISANFERQTITSGPSISLADTGLADAYAIPVSPSSTGVPLQFRALNTNTGASTLTTPMTGTKSLVNADVSPLTAGTIRANAAIQVLYDGSQFTLTKRPFNDRAIIIDSN